MDKYNEKITFYLPGAFTSFFELLSYLMENYSHRKEIFKDERHPNKHDTVLP